MAITNFNKIINLTFMDSNGKEVFKITTPTKGIKPNIVLEALFVCSDLASNINVTIKNFYFAQSSKTYEKLKIEAGYSDKLDSTLQGTISYMYQENVGPESQTVICCKLDNKFEGWMNKTVELSYQTSYKLSEVLQAISTQLGYDQKPEVSTDDELQEPLQFTGTCREAINTLKKRFEVTINNVDGKLVANKTGKAGNRVPIDIKILSSPPVIKSGSGDTANSVMVTMPWHPNILVGSYIKIPMNVYSTSELVNGVTGTATLEITSINVQFATVTNANRMTVEGIVTASGSATK